MNTAVRTPGLTLYVGNRNYSSWSLRPWLVLSWSGLPFEERLVSLDQPGYGTGEIAELQALSPTGRVPVLHADGMVVFDSLAIAEWIAEFAPDARLWPEDPVLRAKARAATCLMHSGFFGLRRDLPMNLRRRVDAPAWLRRHGRSWAEDTRADLQLADEFLANCRRCHEGDGPYLFGRRTIADAFYTPVAARFRSYSILLGSYTQAYCELLLGDVAFRDWEARARAEWRAPFSRAALDDLYDTDLM